MHGDGQAERMNRTTADATDKVFHDEDEALGGACLCLRHSLHLRQARQGAALKTVFQTVCQA